MSTNQKSGCRDNLVLGTSSNDTWIHDFVDYVLLHFALGFPVLTSLASLVILPDACRARLQGQVLRGDLVGERRTKAEGQAYASSDRKGVWKGPLGEMKGARGRPVFLFLCDFNLRGPPF